MAGSNAMLDTVSESNGTTMAMKNMMHLHVICCCSPLEEVDGDRSG